MILSVASPALEAVLNQNKSANEMLVSAVKVLNKIGKDLKLEVSQTCDENFAC